jgi:hypothetical protein
VRLRLVAGLCALAALGLHLGWTRPFRAAASAAADEYRQLRDERSQATVERAHGARLAAAPGRIGVVPGTSASAPLPGAARRLVVGTLASSGVSTVKLRVTPGGRGPVAASVHLSGAGSLDEVARFTGELVRPGNGLVLSSVSLVPREGQVDLAFDALALGAR